MHAQDNEYYTGQCKNGVDSIINPQTYNWKGILTTEMYLKLKEYQKNVCRRTSKYTQCIMHTLYCVRVKFKRKTQPFSRTQGGEHKSSNYLWTDLQEAEIEMFTYFYSIVDCILKRRKKIIVFEIDIGKFFASNS